MNLSMETQPSPRRAAALCAALAFGATVVAFAADASNNSDVWQARWVLLVALVANLAAALWDKDDDDIEMASGFICVAVAAASFGPVATLLVAAVSALPFLLASPQKAWRCAATRMFSGVMVSAWFSGALPEQPDAETFLLGAFVAAAVYQGFQVWTTTAVLTFEHGGNPLPRLKRMTVDYSVAFALFGPMAAAFAYLTQLVPQSVLLAAFASAAAHQMLVTAQRSRGFERLLSELSAEIPGALLAALDAADAYTAQHSASVASYAYDIARAVGLDDRHARVVHAAALLHDVGKIGVPDAVLTKPSRLDNHEWELMKRHPEIGANIVRRLPGFDVLEAGIMHHHERLNGTGYPDALPADRIPLDARIIAVADTYSAITTTRSYRKARDPQFAIAELRKDAEDGRLSDELVGIFVTLLDQADDRYATGRHTTLQKEVARVRGWLDLPKR